MCIRDRSICPVPLYQYIPVKLRMQEMYNEIIDLLMIIINKSNYNISYKQRILKKKNVHVQSKQEKILIIKKGECKNV